MGSKGAPKPDPRIGEAALKSAETGESYLAFMKDQAAITNRWAEEDRADDREIYRPLRLDFVEEAKGYDTPERRAAAAARAGAGVTQEYGAAQDAMRRQMEARGVDPNSGRWQSVASRAETDEALARTGAGNMERRRIESEGRALRADAVNMGSGFAVNPGTSMGLSNQSVSSGFRGAMQGHRQMGNLLNTQYQQRMQTWQAKNAMMGGLFGALGKGIGAIAGGGAFLSDEDAKTDKRPAPRNLDAIRQMPVEKWRYKDGMGDGGEVDHVGTYAQDFQKATGAGDGRSINMMDAVGVTMGAVKELDGKVERMADALDQIAGRKASAPPAARRRGISMGRSAA
ncbi:UNVERIFIED_CONTAM: hypothetical protein BEN50_22385 [Euhalothece sp. KZN 001]